MKLTALEYIYAIIIITYIIGAFSTLFFYKKHKIASIFSNIAAVVASALGIIFSVLKFFLFNKEKIEFSFSTDIYNLSISIFIDNLSAFFIMVISVLALFVSIYSFGYLKHYFNKRNVSVFGFLYNIFILSMILVVTAGHLFFFLIVWEIMSLVSYFLVVFENEKIETQKAGTMYVIMTHIGTAFITAAFILIYIYTKGNTSFTGIDGTQIPSNIKNVIFIFSLIGFGTKAGIIPLHIWLPMAHPAAPSNVSALMSGVMIKTAVYGILRVVLGILGGEYLWWGTIILIIGGISAILGIAYALMEIDIKRLLAYSSVENIGIIFVGIGLSLIAHAKGNELIAAFSLTAALFHVFNHSIFKGLLFLGVGSIHYSTKTKNMEKLGGLIKKMPYTAVFFLGGALAISSIPPFNGFVSEWLTYQSLFMNISINGDLLKIVLILIVALLAMAGVLAASSFIKTFGISFLALPRTNHAEEAKEVPKSMLIAMGSLVALCIAIGIFPLIFMSIIDKVNLQMFDVTILNNISGFSSFVLYPVKINNATFSFPALLVIAAILILALTIFIYFIRKTTKSRKYVTWACGYKGLDSRMEYTATGFSKPIRIIFRAIFKPQRELKVEEVIAPYFIKSAKYNVSTQSIFEKYLYEPIIKNVVRFARRAKYTIQTGSIHTYLVYIFLVIVAMFIYYAKS